MSRSPSGPHALADAVTSGVAATAEHDAPGLEGAVRALAQADPERVRLLLGHVVRSLVEELHPDGLDSADVEALLRATYAESAWCDDVDPSVLLTVLAGALGVHPDEQADDGGLEDGGAGNGGRGAGGVRGGGPEPVVRHALLLVGSLLRRRARAPGVTPVEPYVTAALDELKRAETIELP